jgi:hypothetical protein
MARKGPEEKRSALELKYEEALKAIAGGDSWEKVIADSVLKKKKRHWALRILDSLGRNLAGITSLVVAASGITFGILQYRTSEAQKTKEMQLAEVDALQKLIPSLTSESRAAQGYAFAVLLTLYPSANDPSSADRKKLMSLLQSLGSVGSPETIAGFAREMNDDGLKKKAAELYADRAEHTRRELAAASGQQGADKQQSFDKERQYVVAARDDAEQSLSLDPDNAKALYQSGRLLMDYSGDLAGASERFSRVIKLIEENKYPKDNEIYLRSFLNKTLCLYLPENKITPAVCDAYKLTKNKFAEAGEQLDVKQERLEAVDAGCR